MPIGSSCSRTVLMRVVFPAPDGPETMNNVPSGWKLLDILYLLAYPLHLGFQFYNERSQRRGARLRAHRVHFAQHLLRKKIELLSGGVGAVHGLLRLFDVMRETRQLFGHVALLDHDHDFLGDAVLVYLDSGSLSDFLYALLVGGEQLAADLVAMRCQPLLELANRL